MAARPGHCRAVKRSYPVRHPPVPPQAQRGELTPSDEALLSHDEPAAPAPGSPAPLPHERDESRHGQASGTPLHQPVGRQAFDDATGPTEDTDRGPVMDPVYHERVKRPKAPS
jgi:hypothetical protein